MTPRFNLIDEPWLPCTLRDGTSQEMGLRATLARSSEIREIDDASPLVTIALYRLLLAVLHRVFGPESMAEWHALWQVGSFDSSRLNAYLDQWHSRFDLFDERYPFYQTPGLNFDRYAGPVAKLTHELASGNNVTLFDHTTMAARPAFHAARAARYLVAYQAFAVSGLVTREKETDKSATGAPLMKMAVHLVKGSNLFRTLMLNLLAYSPAEEVPFPTNGADQPAWERDVPTEPGERQVAGYLDLLTWQSRRIRLRGEVDGIGTPIVRDVIIMKGAQFPSSYVARSHETMAAFSEVEKPKPDQDPYLAVGFRQDRALWRDSLVLLQGANASSHRACTLNWIDNLTGYDYLERTGTVPLEIFGMHVDPKKVASVVFWRRERLPLPLAYLREKRLLDRLGQALQAADDVSKDLSRAIWILATLLLAPEADQEGSRQPAKEDVRPLMDSVAATDLYWSALETRFKEFMVQLAQDQQMDEDENVVYGLEALPQWIAEIQRIARHAFDETTRSLDTSARTLKAAARATHQLNIGLKKTIDKYVTSAEREEGEVRERVI